LIVTTNCISRFGLTTVSPRDPSSRSQGLPGGLGQGWQQILSRLIWKDWKMYFEASGINKGPC
jgi:hypothetical protein